MKRLYEAQAYAADAGAFWKDTTPPLEWPVAEDANCDVAIIGAGFTGLNAAITLARAGRDVRVLDAEHPGWGASGRNGGFCCIGGALVGDSTLARRHGAGQAASWQATQQAAIDHVDAFLSHTGAKVDRHSHGETVLAHTPRAFKSLRAEAEDHSGARLLSPEDLRTEGLSTTWHGGLHIPTGFALNPRKYHSALAQAALDAGATLHAYSPVTKLYRDGLWHLQTPKGTIRARQVILATNGYSSEDLPAWLRARTLPVQSSVIVTRPLTDAELAEANWTSEQMAYDTRQLLHYFRKLPDNRFLFGMRGGLTARPAEQMRISQHIRRDFNAAFPAWRDVEITHEWSGLVCLMASGHPFCGAVPEHEGLFASLGYHGNGVAMGSYLGHGLAQKMIGDADPALPAFLSKPPKRFPFGAYRRQLLRPAYMFAETFDL
ncbi:glycine/D-amino acid oxidase-like deaminating enzyme [Sagittula marina]|uniref:Glycine/D-amino acid oxidase-like deaminating enzyme n=1 Tax=Sagittula marina TaxID=943940 RepID=A0A7W6DNE0_9RHOB|nr:glycine/D-amino acid oxidase-like deaminating enzyme [Sagittula marina]